MKQKNDGEMDGKSEDLRLKKINRMKELFPEVFTEGKIDVEKLKLTLGEDVNIKDERYVLNWAGKSEAFKVLQTPTTATLAPSIEESIDFDKTENVFIEGENLEVLKVLQKSYYNKIKMIYIDPPYNTGNDSFIYPDKFSESKEEYLKRIGDKDEDGYLLKEGLFRKNSKESGHYHSNWLSMMYPRLFLARNLLRDDGVIFVSIDDNEVHNLRMIMNEIFGEENYFAILTRKAMHTVRNSSKDFNKNADFILVYAKYKTWFESNKNNYIREIKDKKDNYPYDDNDGRGVYKLDPLYARNYYTLYKYVFKNGVKWEAPEGSFPRYSEDTLDWMEAENRIVFSGKEPKAKRYLKEVQEGQPPDTILKTEDVGFNFHGTKILAKMLDSDKIFSQPKPVELLKYLISLLRDNNAIILDFFAGSGTTAHAVYELNKEDNGNRKYICVQLAEKTEENSEAYKAGYKTIADICKERIRRVIKNIKDEKKNNPTLFDSQKKDLDLGFKVFKLKQSNFKIWRNDIAENENELGKQLDAFENPVKKEAKNENMLWEILLKSGYDLNTKIDEKKISGCFIYAISDSEMIVCLAEINEDLVKEITKLKPKKCICLDNLFAKNDQLKTNTALQLKDADVEFKTI